MNIAKKYSPNSLKKRMLFLMEIDLGIYRSMTSDFIAVYSKVVRLLWVNHTWMAGGM
jgi:hypothetical protein